VFTKNRDRLLEADVAREFLAHLVAQARAKGLTFGWSISRWTAEEKLYPASSAARRRLSPAATPSTYRRCLRLSLNSSWLILGPPPEDLSAKIWCSMADTFAVPRITAHLQCTQVLRNKTCLDF
jgi:hypothetical protein